MTKMNGGELRGGEEQQGELIPHIRIPVTNKPEDMKAESKEPRSDQVTQRCQVGDGEVVRIEVPAPHPVHHPVSNVEQNENLGGRQKRATSAPTSATPVLMEQHCSPSPLLPFVCPRHVEA